MRRAEAIIYPANTKVLSRTDRSLGLSRSARRVSAALLHSPTCSVTVLAPRSALLNRSCLRSCLHLPADAFANNGKRPVVHRDDVIDLIFLDVRAGIEDLPVAVRAFDLRRLLRARHTAE